MAMAWMANSKRRSRQVGGSVKRSKHIQSSNGRGSFDTGLFNRPACNEQPGSLLEGNSSIISGLPKRSRGISRDIHNLRRHATSSRDVKSTALSTPVVTQPISNRHAQMPEKQDRLSWGSSSFNQGSARGVNMGLLSPLPPYQQTSAFCRHDQLPLERSHFADSRELSNEFENNLSPPVSVLTNWKTNPTTFANLAQQHQSRRESSNWGSSQGRGGGYPPVNERSYGFSNSFKRAGSSRNSPVTSNFQEEPSYYNNPIPIQGFKASKYNEVVDASTAERKGLRDFFQRSLPVQDHDQLLDHLNRSLPGNGFESDWDDQQHYFGDEQNKENQYESADDKTVSHSSMWTPSRNGNSLTSMNIDRGQPLQVLSSPPQNNVAPAQTSFHSLKFYQTQTQTDFHSKLMFRSPSAHSDLSINFDSDGPPSQLASPPSILSTTKCEMKSSANYPTLPNESLGQSYSESTTKETLDETAIGLAMSSWGLFSVESVKVLPNSPNSRRIERIAQFFNDDVELEDMDMQEDQEFEEEVSGSSREEDGGASILSAAVKPNKLSYEEAPDLPSAVTTTGVSNEQVDVDTFKLDGVDAITPPSRTQKRHVFDLPDFAEMRSQVQVTHANTAATNLMSSNSCEVKVSVDPPSVATSTMVLKVKEDITTPLPEQIQRDVPRAHESKAKDVGSYQEDEVENKIDSPIATTPIPKKAAFSHHPLAERCSSPLPACKNIIKHRQYDAASKAVSSPEKPYSLSEMLKMEKGTTAWLSVINSCLKQHV